MWSRILRPGISLLALMTLVLGLVYPLLVTGLGGALFPVQAQGSMVRIGDKVVGSWLIGQSFSAPGYFWGRPSATAPLPYNPMASGGSNLGPLNPALGERMKASAAALKAADPSNPLPIPADLLTASASGLDPDISVAAARYQAARVARARALSVAAVNQLIDAQLRPGLLGVLGDARVNVLELNMALDRMR
jgi:potassium-transporting ATPase KdpC subunit